MVIEEVYDALILFVDNPLDSWVLDSEVSFHTTAIHEVLENYVAGDFEEVYFADSSVLDIVGMVMFALESTVTQYENCRKSEMFQN
jgi:hypothetical protein